MAKEDVEAAMTLFLLRGEVVTGFTENGAKIHGRHDLPPKKKEKDELEESTMSLLLLSKKPVAENGRASLDLDLLPD
ncbi:hypothetical protein QYF36_016208 [Acer negundo]|nr:hypothetical protein QYF36_016208 [Acer negundo]